jgi:hypothetical protein
MALEESILAEARSVRERMLVLQRDTEQARVDFHHAVRRLHASGGTLREIAQALHISHQRVHQIVDGETDPGMVRRVIEKTRGPRPASAGPFKRFAGDARQVVVEAQEEAHALGHDYVGTEHLLLGLLRRSEAPAGRALTSLGLTLEDARARVEDMVGRGQGTPPGAIPFTPRSKKVLEVALREALKSGEPEIGTQHLLFALMRDRNGVAAQVLKDRGIRRDQVEAALADA